MFASGLTTCCVVVPDAISMTLIESSFVLHTTRQPFHSRAQHRRVTADRDVVFELSGFRSTTLTVPVLAIPRSSTTVFVPADVAVVCRIVARRPPMFETIRLSPSNCTSKGATPTSRVRLIFPVASSTGATVFFFERQTKAVFSSLESVCRRETSRREFELSRAS